MFNIAIERPKPQRWMIHACGAIVLGALSLAFYSCLYAPAESEIDERTKRMEQLQSLMANNEQIAEEHQRLESRLTALRSAAALSKKRMPRRVSSKEFVDRATQLAESLDLKMDMCTAAAPQTYRTHMQVEVTCRLHGSYASVCRFLAAIDQFSQISKVSHFEIDTAADSGEYPANVTFQLYYRGEVNDTEQKRGALS
jgi:Tfp pilus assembly protein PilO